ncbi:MAG: hypothetical protein V2I39_10810 [Erythrobacter sp.]|jgi:hypothetical protein|nr:hypothetical protein [Erythrobacter sp.]
MPDRDDWPDPREEDIMAGDRRISRPDSSLPDWYISDASYRPIPIAWFAAAVLIQAVVAYAVFFALMDENGWITLGLTGLASLAIYFWSLARGLAAARPGWRIALGVVLVLQFLLVTIGTSPRL